MSLYDRDLKVYAESGLRSALDWDTLGREVETGVAPRVNVQTKGKPVDLYTRDQTRIRPKSVRRAAATAAVTADAKTASK